MMSTSLAPRTGLIGVPSTHGLALPPDLTFEEWRGALETADMLVAAGPWRGATSYRNMLKLRRDPDRDSGPVEVSTPRLVGSPEMHTDPTTMAVLPSAEAWWPRFAAKIAVAENGCWHWTASLHPTGYGRFGIKNRIYKAHRVAYEAVRGPIAPGLCIDHVCHNRDSACGGAWGCLHRRCVNPAHLEAVSIVENVMRGQSFFARQARATHCRNGHPFDADNTYVTKQGRHCKTCRLANNRAFCRRKREAS